MDKKRNRVTAFAPATVANVACGFDVLGFAIHGLGDRLTASFSEKPGLSIESITGDDGRLPLSVKENTAGLAVLSLLDELEKPSESGIVLSIEKQMPLGSGLGSSAASSVAAVVAVNELLGNPFSKKNLLPFAVAGEMAFVIEVIPAVLAMAAIDGEATFVLMFGVGQEGHSRGLSGVCYGFGGQAARRRGPSRIRMFNRNGCRLRHRSARPGIGCVDRNGCGSCAGEPIRPRRWARSLRRSPRRT